MVKNLNDLVIDSMENIKIEKIYKLNLDKITSLDDCKKILKFLCGIVLKPQPVGVEYRGFSDVKDYFN